MGLLSMYFDAVVEDVEKYFFQNGSGHTVHCTLNFFPDQYKNSQEA